MNGDPRNILIIRFSSMGDILLTTPLLRAVKKKFPESKIHYVIKAQFSDLLRVNPYVDVIHFFNASGGLAELFRLKSELQKTEFDVILDLHANPRSFLLRRQIRHRLLKVFKKYRLERFLFIKFRMDAYRHIPDVTHRYLATVQDFGVMDDKQGPDFILDPAVFAGMKERLRSLGLKKNRLTVCICPGAGFATKRWPVQYFARLACRLVADKNAQILILGSGQDILLADEIAGAAHPCINIAGQTTLMESACAMALADVIISNDTGLMHLSNALKKKTVAIFGSTTRELGFFPLPELSLVVENTDLSCRPCSHTGLHRCPEKHFRCMKEIQPESVYRAVGEILDRPT
jgi:lipopolysaccharide heptosyltransferase II